MNARLQNTAQPWVDPDDAPELTDGDFQRGTWHIGNEVVTKEVAQAAISETLRRGRPPLEVKRPMVSMRMDPDVLAHLRASGKGWQTKVNALLRQAVEQGQL